jgi:hypothetical protein
MEFRCGQPIRFDGQGLARGLHNHLRLRLCASQILLPSANFVRTCRRAVADTIHSGHFQTDTSDLPSNVRDILYSYVALG